SAPSPTEGRTAMAERRMPNAERRRRRQSSRAEAPLRGGPYAPAGSVPDVVPPDRRTLSHDYPPLLPRARGGEGGGTCPGLRPRGPGGEPRQLPGSSRDRAGAPAADLFHGARGDPGGSGARAAP